MAGDPLDRAVEAYAKAREAIPAAQVRAKKVVADARVAADLARLKLADEIAAAAERGVRQKVLVERTGYTRETIRRILREHGIEAED